VIEVDRHLAEIVLQLLDDVGVERELRGIEIGDLDEPSALFLPDPVARPESAG
jgi:hypothetical protein